MKLRRALARTAAAVADGFYQERTVLAGRQRQAAGSCQDQTWQEQR
jgi:hypothetical protein